MAFATKRKRYLLRNCSATLSLSSEFLIQIFTCAKVVLKITYFSELAFSQGRNVYCLLEPQLQKPEKCNC